MTAREVGIDLDIAVRFAANAARCHTLSMTTAIPCPPPMHALPTA